MLGKDDYDEGGDDDDDDVINVFQLVLQLAR